MDRDRRARKGCAWRTGVAPCRRLAVGFLIATGLATAGLLAREAAAADPSAPLEISKAWAPAVGRSGADTPIYMTIVNRRAEPDDLLRVRCPVANFAEKRTTDYGEGAPAAREVKSIPVPANETLTLKPGGYHLMLLKTTQALKEGEEFSCSLSFRKAGSQQLKVTVAAEGAQTAP